MLQDNDSRDGNDDNDNNNDYGDCDGDYNDDDNGGDDDGDSCRLVVGIEFNKFSPLSYIRTR